VSLSVVIVTYNNAADIEQCLLALKRGVRGLEHEVIVVDNASTDDTVTRVLTIEGVRLYRSVTNLGFAAADNAGAELATCEYLLLLNPDAILDE
jgi:GT2 family glycosyltransferase